MSKKISLRSPQGCFLLLIQIIGIIANIKDVLEFFSDLNDNVIKPFVPQEFNLTGDFFLSGAVLFYGVTAVALMAWWVVAYKALGTFQSFFSVFVLHLLGSSLFIVSFVYKFKMPFTVENLVIGIFLFVLLPLAVGYVILTLFSSPDKS
jgi:hypothetical protein